MNRGISIFNKIYPYLPQLMLLGIMAIPLAVSTTLLINQSIRLDEAQSLWQTSRTTGFILKIVAEDVHVPLYHLILHLWMGLFGNTILAARSLSLLFFVLTIPASYMLAKFIYRRERVALFAAFLISISPFLNWYANEARMYSLLTLIVILNQYCFLRIMRKNDALSWQFYLITGIVGVYTHYFFFAYLLTHVIFFFLQRKQFPENAFKRFIGCAIATILAFAPWVYLVISAGTVSSTQPLLAKPSTNDLFNTFSQFLFGFQESNINAAILSLWPIIILLAFMLLRQKQEARQDKTVFLVLSVFTPIIVAFCFSWLVRPFYLSRYLVFTIPSLYILISHILAGYPPRLANLFRTLLICSMVVGLLLQSTNFYSPVKEDYEAAAEYVTKNATFRDVVVLSAPFTIYPFEYYYRGQAQLATFPIWNRADSGSIPRLTPEQLTADVAALVENHETLWLLLSYDQGYEETIRLYFDERYQRSVEATFSPELTLYVYRLPLSY
jgi:mannosyltransferase